MFTWIVMRAGDRREAFLFEGKPGVPTHADRLQTLEDVAAHLLARCPEPPPAQTGKEGDSKVGDKL
jgi:hypothetical protein